MHRATRRGKTVGSVPLPSVSQRSPIGVRPCLRCRGVPVPGETPRGRVSRPRPRISRAGRSRRVVRPVLFIGRYDPQEGDAVRLVQICALLSAVTDGSAHPAMLVVRSQASASSAGPRSGGQGGRPELGQSLRSVTPTRSPASARGPVEARLQSSAMRPMSSRGNTGFWSCQAGLAAARAAPTAETRWALRSLRTRPLPPWPDALRPRGAAGLMRRRSAAPIRLPTVDSHRGLRTSGRRRVRRMRRHR